MLIVPLQATPSQIVSVLLAGQDTRIAIYQESFGLFMDLSVAGTPIVTGVICQNLNRIVRDLYLGFVGDFIFIDNQGATDPVFTGLGARYSLAYLEASDLNGAG